MKKHRVVVRNLIVLMTLVMVIMSILPAKVEAARGFSMKYKKTTVTPGSKADKILDKAGEPKSTKKKNSCATEGYDYTRTYKDFVLYTYTNTKKKNAAEYVSRIKFLTDEVETSEGLTIGSTEKTLKKKYRGAKENFGVYSKTKGKTKINITVSGGKVTGIEVLSK